MNPIFTLADTSHLNLLLVLMREFYTHEHIAFDEQAARQALLQIINDRSFGHMYVISLGDTVIGYLVLTFGFSLEFHGRHAFVDEIYLRESHRGKGIGTIGLQFIEDVCRKEKISAVRLEVARTNTKAQAVYRQVGYNDHDRYLLTKWLQER